MSEKHHIIPVWFFVGVLLFIYGIMVFLTGIVEWHKPAEGVQLTDLHAPVWWGALLIVLGGIYCSVFRPGKN